MSDTITIRFYGDLNDFLPPEQRQLAFEQPFRIRTIKDLFESLGVPHPEVDLILANGHPTGFNYHIQPKDHISIYPAFSSLDISPLTQLQPAPLKPQQFVLDCHLGRLAAWLRLLGFDTLYQNNYDDADLAHISAEKNRILLTCDRQLLMRREISRGYFVRSRQPQSQLPEVVQRFELQNSAQPFTRCMHCNGLVHKIDKDMISQELPQRTKEYFNEFWQCNSCKNIYWKGSHYDRMQKIIDNVHLN